MKVVILAGGLGTRLSEETAIKPKPMVEIGGKPILWHIMKIYSAYGFNEFVICLGYKGYYIKEWFNNYYLHNSDVTFDLSSNNIKYHKTTSENWKVTLVDTGENTMTGGRIKRIQKYVDEKTFMATYGDGVSNIDIDKLLTFHKRHGKLATLTSVVPEGRFGALRINEANQVTSFQEKMDNNNWVNAGFFVLEPGIFDYISGDDSLFEEDALPVLSKNGELFTYKHTGFWKPIDKLFDKNKLEERWQKGDAPWRIWDRKITLKINKKQSLTEEKAEKS